MFLPDRGRAGGLWRTDKGIDTHEADEFLRFCRDLAHEIELDHLHRVEKEYPTMLTGEVYLKGDSLILRDVDGSEHRMTLHDALHLLLWLQEHKMEIEHRMLESHEESDLQR